MITRRALLYILIAVTVFTVGFMVFTSTNTEASEPTANTESVKPPEPEITLIPAIPMCDGEYPYMMQNPEGPNSYSCDGIEWFGVDWVTRHIETNIETEQF